MFFDHAHVISVGLIHVVLHLVRFAEFVFSGCFVNGLARKFGEQRLQRFRLCFVFTEQAEHQAFLIHGIIHIRKVELQGPVIIICCIVVILLFEKSVSDAQVSIVHFKRGLLLFCRNEFAEPGVGIAVFLLFEIRIPQTVIRGVEHIQRNSTGFEKKILVTLYYVLEQVGVPSFLSQTVAGFALPVFTQGGIFFIDGILQRLIKKPDRVLHLLVIEQLYAAVISDLLVRSLEVGRKHFYVLNGLQCRLIIFGSEVYIHEET